MKKQIILLVTFMSLTFTNASTKTISTTKIGVNNRFNNAVTFVERGVKFHVFLNGDFDFNTHRNSRYNYGVRIKRDHRGRVRRIGNVFVNYDRRGNVKRIGNVYMNYRFGQLTRVGNLFIKYDRWGNPIFRGHVKSNRYYYYDNDRYDDRNCSVDLDVDIDDIYDYDDVYFYRNSFSKNYRQIREDDDFYYYRAVPNASIGKRSKLIKRRKIKKKKENELSKRSRR